MEASWGTYGKASGPDTDGFQAPIATAQASWSGFPTELRVLPGNAEVSELRQAHPTLAVALKGRGKRRYAVGRSTRHLYSAPSMFELYSPDHVIDHGVWEGERGEVLSLQFPTPLVNRLLHAEGTGFQLETAHELYDARLTDLATATWVEAARGNPCGRLYAEGLSIAILGLLIEEYGACRKAVVTPHARLSPSERKRIADYIEHNIAESLSLEDLASTLQMSATHFSRMFKASFGVTPHLFVVEQRINAACSKLKSAPELSLADVAYSLGFSSQSHFTSAFRRKTGMTPGTWRDR